MQAEYVAYCRNSMPDKPPSFMKRFLREWKMNAVRQSIVGVALGPLFIFYMVVQSWPFWLILVTLPLVVAWIYFMAQWVWKIYPTSADPPRPPPTPEQVWEARFQKVADTTDDLPQGLTLASFCLEYDESVLRKAMHTLHRTPPGSRHLRVALQELI